MMEIEKDMEVEGSLIRCIQRTPESEKVLDYDYKRCRGCSICVVLCPKKALSEGPLKEIGTGLDAPPVLIDLDSCVFCGMCANLCPMRAFRMTIEEKEAQADKDMKEEEAGGAKAGTRASAEAGSPDLAEAHGERGEA